MTETTVKHLDPTQVELEFGVTADELEGAREKAFRELAKRAKVRGFRPGKVPRKIFEATYGTAAIDERAMDEVVPEAYARALRENGLEPVDRPQVELVPQEGASDLKLRATVSVRPAITLGAYNGIEIGSTETTVSEDEVGRSLDALRRDAATLVPVERPVQQGDVATLDFEGTIDGVPFEGGSAKEQATEIREDRFIPGFAAGIVGMSAGETKQIEARFPDDYAQPELAGKTAVFTVTVHDVKVSELPALDDEFAASLLREGTLDGLRANLRDRLERTSEVQARRAATAELLEKLRAMHDIPLPEVLVERETNSLVEDAHRQVERVGIDWSDYLQRSNRSDDDVRADCRIEAERRVKTSLLLEEIARKEHIEASPADINTELANLSAQYGRPQAEIAQVLRPNMDALVDGIVRSKTVEFLMSHARRVESTPAPAS